MPTAALLATAYLDLAERDHALAKEAALEGDIGAAMVFYMTSQNARWNARMLAALDNIDPTV